MSLPPLLFLTLVADRKLKPAAVELRIGQGDPRALLPFALDERLSVFSASFPCLIRTDLAQQLSPELLVALREAGCQPISEEQFCHYDGEENSKLPPAVRWLFGDWYLAPPAKKSTSQAASQRLSLRLLQLVATDAETREIEAIFRQDPVLAYHLLRLVNSFGVGVGRHISSFSQALLILGRQQLKRWLNLMLFAAIREDHRSAMLFARVAVRARTMELLARAAGLERPLQEQSFMAGMFSLLGSLFGLPLASVLKPLKLNDILTNAVLDHAGVLGRLLRAAESAECMDEPELTQQMIGFGLSIADFNRLRLEAYQWTLSVIHERKATVDA